MPVGRKHGGGVPYGGRSQCRICGHSFYYHELDEGLRCKECAAQEDGPRKMQIPFRVQFKEAMLSGKKTWTSRTRKLADPGDLFEAFGRAFQIKQVFTMKLDVVAWLHSSEEGVDSPAEFIRLWNKLHPYRKYNPKDTVYVHQFKMLGGE